MIYILKQPNNKYSAFSTKINSVIMHDMEVYHLIEYYVSEYPETKIEEMVLMLKTINDFGKSYVNSPEYEKCLEFTRLNDNAFYKKIIVSNNGRKQ